ncbi:AEC family transporter [Lacrimispora sp. NSJ-141]|uniref:AEC family transporter n=1 Tax=Lientehia hominis TaxID=2897778 RepID=A0AAP2RID1_9FIRM|nr:AEC family transporter [Lientehia hominis]MCD2492577.1 AEC family transporter [Lientehia hominis]
MDAGIVFQKMLVLLIMIFAGCLVYRLGIIGKETSRQISSLMIKVLNPALLLSSAMGDKGNVTGKELLIVAAFTILMFAFLIVLGIPFGALFGKTKEEKLMYNMMTVFSNLAFIGIPVVKALYGDKAVIYASVFNLGYSCCFYTYGMMLVDKAAGVRDKGFSLKSLWNPGVVSCLLTLLLTVTKFRLPFFISGPVEYLGSASVPIALLTVGISLAQNDWKSIFLDWKVYVYSILKLVVIPVACVFLLRFLPIDETILGVTAVMLAMPVGNMAVIAAESVGMDGSVCARGIMVSTIMTLVTVPMVAAMV